jgi:hypothetical protein
MVNQSVDYSRVQGEAAVVARLRAQGYDMVADEVAHLLALERALSDASRNRTSEGVATVG